MPDHSLGLTLIIVGTIFCVIAVFRLMGSLRVRTKDGISKEAGYHTPSPRWGFFALGILMMVSGYVFVTVA